MAGITSRRLYMQGIISKGTLKIAGDDLLDMIWKSESYIPRSSGFEPESEILKKNSNILRFTVDHDKYTRVYLKRFLENSIDFEAGLYLMRIRAENENIIISFHHA